MDAGQQLLSLIEARVAAGENRYSAERRVFHEHSTLAREWHHAEGQDPPETSRRHEVEPTHADPGMALLQLLTAYERAGMDRSAAMSRAFAEYPALVQAWNAGQLIPKAPPRPMLPATRQRQLWSSQDPLRPGEVLCHKLADPTAGGGWFAVVGA